MVKKIQNYYLQEVVGEGEYGKVYRATNERTNELVAIKVIKIEKFKLSPKLEECTINEIQTLSKIEANEHVVKFMEILKTVNNYYFVYEYCNGGTLQKMIRNEECFSEAKALAYFGDMLKAFKTLTKYNIMHRDIKPGNILLHNGVIKIADFGFCKPLGSSRDLAQTMLGSPIYMAPEILRGQVYTIKADIWSLGVVLYQMLFGFCPFQQKSIAKLLTLLEEAQLSFPKNKNNISAKTEELLRRMLVKDHFKRITWEELFQFDLGEGLRSRPSLERRMGDVDITANNNNSKLEPALTLQPLPLTSNTGFTKKNSYDPTFKKAVSQNEVSGAGQSGLTNTLMGLRNRMRSGVQMLTDLLTNHKSKPALILSTLLMSKVKSIAQILEQCVRKSELDKENQRDFQIKRLASVLREEIGEIKQRATLFEQQRRKHAEDDKWAFEMLRQESRERSAEILQYWDFLSSDCTGAEKKNYGRMGQEVVQNELSRRLRA